MPLCGASDWYVLCCGVAEEPWRRLAINNQAALIDNRWKLVRVGDGDYVLFDLVADQAEAHDLAAEHPERVAQMSKMLDAWRLSCLESLEGQNYAGSRP